LNALTKRFQVFHDKNDGMRCRLCVLSQHLQLNSPGKATGRSKIQR
jgi:hypothetical protein